LQIKTKIVSCHKANSKPVKQEVNGTVILPPLVFPDFVGFAPWRCVLALLWHDGLLAVGALKGLLLGVVVLARQDG
jgi:hypothetical protein